MSPLKLIIIFIAFLTACSSSSNRVLLKQIPLKNTPISQVNSKSEIRAAWIPTVNNMNWPSRPGLSAEKQKIEIIELLDLAQEKKINTLFFQVRCQADAFYPSHFAPWSSFLSGDEGKDPGYDPLKTWLDESKKRNIALHAWINPYRSRIASTDRPSQLNAATAKHAKEFNSKYQWLDPSSKKVRQSIVYIVRELLDNYDLAGIHFDDYFYPYKEIRDYEDFPDTKAYLSYRVNGGKLNRKDWRREQVNSLIRETSQLVRERKKIFSISPFGIWKPGYPEGIEGTSSHDSLYCDSRKWLREEMVDWIIPQLYWPHGRQGQEFDKLAKWWAQEKRESKSKTKLIIGLAKWRTDNIETSEQVKLCKELPEINGVSFFHLKSLGTDALQHYASIQVSPK